MKPRRWYSSPEIKPLASSHSVWPFPAGLYWAFTALTRSEQGPIIKSAPPDVSAPPHGHDSTALVPTPRVRRINAA
ncbi:MAG: hypothetical protein WCG26_00560 [Chloroflexales bacterium]